MRNNNYILYCFLITVVLMIAAFYVGRLSAPAKVEYYAQEIIKYDTTFIEKENPPIILEKVVPKIIYKSDTVIETRPFTASIDTVIVQDTIKVAYDFPENKMDIDIRLRPDSVIQRTVTITKFQYEKRAWWIDVLTHAGAFGIGYILTK